MWPQRIALFLIVMVCVPVRAKTEEPRSIALRFQLDNALRERFQNTELEKMVGNAIVDSILANPRWFKFCWHLIRAEDGTTYPEGELLIGLRERSDRRNWEITCSLRKEVGGAQMAVDLPPYSVLAENELIAIGGTSRNALPSKASQWFIDNYLKGDELHGKLCEHVPVTRGIIAVPAAVPSNEKLGVLFLPFEKYSRFRWSEFRIECEKSGASHNVISCGTGGKLPFAPTGTDPVEFLAVRHRNRSSQVNDNDVGIVYITKYHSEQAPECRAATSTSDAADIPVF